MTSIKIEKFEGLAPKIEPRLLTPSRAQTAENCDLQRGHLDAWNQPSTIWTTTKSGPIKSLYLFGGSSGLTNNQWFHWASDVDTSRGPIAGDVTERTYYTGDTYPKVTRNADALSGSSTNYPVVSYRLGVPSPSSAPTASVTGSADDDKDREDRIYVYTLVTAYGEEGPPSSASSTVNVNDTQAVTLTLPAQPSGNYNWGSGAFKRIYRSASAGSVVGLQFVAEVTIGTTSYIDTTATAALSELIPSTNWFAPPDENYVSGQLLGLTAMPNGVFSGFTSNELHFSEPFMPHAWPEQYRQTLDYDVVALASTSNGLIVATKGQPYVVMGADPASMTARKLETQQACVSKRSMVSMGDFAIYASPDGLVMAAGSTAKLATDALLTRSQWQAYSPSSMIGFYHEGRYVGFYGSGAIIFDPKEQSITEITGVQATAGFNFIEGDDLYLVISGVVKKWNGSSTSLTYKWKSKKFITTHPVNMGVAQVDAEDYTSVTLKIYADDVLKHTQVVTSGDVFRLPSGFLAKAWEIEVTGTSRVTKVYMAETTKELWAI